MIHTQERGTEAGWTETEAEEWSDAIVAAMKLGGVDNLFFVSGSELSFYQEAIAKAQAKGRLAPRLVTMTHEHVALNAALGNAMVRNQPAATAVHVDVGTLHYGAAIHIAWRGGYPVLMMAGTGPRAFPDSMRGARGSGVQWVQEPRDQGEIVRQYTKMDHRMEHQDNPGLMISRLLQVAMSEPRKPPCCQCRAQPDSPLAISSVWRGLSGPIQRTHVPSPSGWCGLTIRCSTPAGPDVMPMP